VPHTFYDPGPNSNSGDLPRKETFDDIDRGVLHALQIDGRRSFRDIGRELGVPEATVRTRVKRLKDRGVLHVIGFIDPMALGYGLLASMLIRVIPSRHEETAKAVSAWPEAMYVSSCAGSADLYVQIFCGTQEQLYNVVSQRMNDLSGIISSELLLEVKIHKAEYVASRLT
jgi:Lrp/AsnC family transcriptional regulator, regulator for asnA, asnC and gidA